MDGKNLKDFLKTDDLQEIEEISSKMSKKHIAESLERLIEREIRLLEDERLKDEEMREITIWNVATLLASLCKIESA